MAERILPRYPVYVISKGRWENPLTAKFLLRDKVPFHLVIEPQEEEQYRKALPEAKFHVLPFSNLGLGGIPARNWCWEHSKKLGHARHWILDDNIRAVRRTYRGKRIRCESGPAFRAIEDFNDRYENLGISGMNYTFFVGPSMTGSGLKYPPFYQNVHVYSCLLIQNSLPYRWRGRYNEDTDLCLQVLSGGWCTVLINAFSIDKMATLTMKGGNMEQLYKGSGRLKMARSLERQWPHVVTVGRRFRRPQHVVRNQWRGFDTQLRLKPGISLEKMKPNEYGLRLTALTDVKSDSLRKFVESNSDSPRKRGSEKAD
jgi:hypothetical protein